MVIRYFDLRLVLLALAALRWNGPADAQEPIEVAPPISSFPDQGTPVRMISGQLFSGITVPDVMDAGPMAPGQPVPGQVVSGHHLVGHAVPGAIYEEESWFDRINPFREVDLSRPVTVAELCRRLDHVTERLRDDGLIVMKQPDVFSQARMTRFRNDVDTQLNSDLGNFHLVLAARINRLDAATTTQSTALSAALAAPGSTAVQVPQLPSSSAITTGGTSLFGSQIDPSKGPFGNLGLAANNFAPLSQPAAATAALGLGVNPTVYLDEKKRFLEHLNHIRRLNLGPDQNDSSGYGLYLVRLPVSITPGERTYHGYGAEVAVHVEHEFSPDFLPSTFKHLVINDVVDQLGPFLYEAIRTGFYKEVLKPLHDARYRKHYLTAQNYQLILGVVKNLKTRFPNVLKDNMKIPGFYPIQDIFPDQRLANIGIAHEGEGIHVAGEKTLKRGVEGHRPAHQIYFLSYGPAER